MLLFAQIEDPADKGISFIEMFLKHPAETQAMACFLIAVLLLITLVIVVVISLRCYKYMATTHAAAINRLSDEIASNDGTNQEILLAVKGVDGRIKGHNDLVKATLIRKDVLDEHTTAIYMKDESGIITVNKPEEAKVRRRKTQTQS